MNGLPERVHLPRDVPTDPSQSGSPKPSHQQRPPLTFSSWHPHSHSGLFSISLSPHIQAVGVSLPEKPSTPRLLPVSGLTVSAWGLGTMHPHLDRTMGLSPRLLILALPVPTLPSLLSQFPLACPIGPASDLLQPLSHLLLWLFPSGVFALLVPQPCCVSPGTSCL